MNHKWENNKCVKCGITREKRQCKIYGIPYSRLGRDGIFYDVNPFEIRERWYYGDQTEFERPECKMIKQFDSKGKPLNYEMVTK